MIQFWPVAEDGPALAELAEHLAALAVGALEEALLLGRPAERLLQDVADAHVVGGLAAVAGVGEQQVAERVGLAGRAGRQVEAAAVDRRQHALVHRRRVLVQLFQDFGRVERVFFVFYTV